MSRKTKSPLCGNCTQQDFVLEPLERRVLLSVTFDTGDLTVLGSPGNDKIIVKAGSDNGTVIVKGDPDGDDGKYTGVNSVTVDAAAGDDKIRVKGKLTDTNGDVLGVTLIGGPGDDDLRGGRGDDTLLGEAGDDKLRGRGGDDTLDGGDDDDKIMGGKGDDMITGGQGNDRLNGQKGKDTVSFETSPTGVNVSLADHRATNDGHGTSDHKIKKFENIVGSAFNDILEGNRRTAVIDGRRGSDNFRGDPMESAFIGGSDPVITASLLNDSGTSNTDGRTFDSTVTGTITDEDRITSFRVGLDDVLIDYYADALTTLQSDGTFTFSLPAIRNGPHTLHLQATDEFGNVSTAYHLDFVLESSLTERSKVDTLGVPIGEFFSGSVSIDGSTAIIGTSGSAYLFDVNDPAEPVQLAELIAPEAEAEDGFGGGVAVSGNTAIVGVSDSAYLFDVTSSDLLATLSSSRPVAIDGDIAIAGSSVFDAVTGDLLGSLPVSGSISISGNIAIVGKSGSVYLFDVSTGDQLAELTGSDTPSGKWWFGVSVAISGRFAVVGAIGDDHAGPFSGSAYLYDVGDPTRPMQLGKLTAPDAATGHQFGESVAVSGNTVVIGSPSDDHAGVYSGSAYLFDVSDPAGPILLAKLTASDAGIYDGFGRSVAIDGDTAIVGATNSVGAGTFSTSAYLFTVPAQMTTPVLSFPDPDIRVELAVDTGVSDSDRITFDPTVTGIVATPDKVTAFRAGFGDTPPAEYSNVMPDFQPDGTFTFMPPRLTEINGGPLSDGLYTLHLEVTYALEVSPQAVELSFTLDTTAPMASATLGSDTTGLSESDSGFAELSLTGTVTDQNTVPSFLIRFYGSDTPSYLVVNRPSTVNADGKFDVSDQFVAALTSMFSFPPVITPPRIQLFAEDVAGNTSDPVDPEVKYIGPPDTLMSHQIIQGSGTPHSTFGSSIANLGDLDGDGVTDLAVGGIHISGLGFGRVTVLFLNHDGSVKSRRSIGPDVGFVLGYSFGGSDNSVAALGDVDGDGVTDLAVGATGDDGAGSRRGAVWILFLRRDGTVKRRQKISDDVGGFTGVLNDGAGFGRTVANLGDLNGDGTPDVAVGGGGSAWVLFLNPDGTVKAHQQVSEITNRFSVVGDLNGNGTNELSVHVPGEIRFLFLNDDGTVGKIIAVNEAAGDLAVLGDDVDRLGGIASGVGDLNGDGVPELAVYLDGITVLYLNPDGEVTAYQNVTGLQKHFVTGELQYLLPEFSNAVAPIGDLNGDGAQDLAVGVDVFFDPDEVWILFLNG